MVNREYLQAEEDFPTVQCVALAREFLQTNHAADNWLLQLELFDPHEPFVAPARFREGLPTEYAGAVLDWPLYDRLDITAAEAAELRANYLAVVAMVDHYIGKLLDDFDRLQLWDDTAIVVTTDHGFLLGEHLWWGKNRMPMYDPVVHIPLLVYHPDLACAGGTSRDALTQCLDVPATLFDLFGLEAPDAQAGHSIAPVLRTNAAVRETALFGIFGGALNITDGRYVYFRYPPRPAADPLFEYTLMPMHPQSYFTRQELGAARLVSPFSFTDGMPVLQVPALADAARPPMQGGALADARSALYDLTCDPDQRTPLVAPEIEARLLAAMSAAVARNDAPPELYRRFDLPSPPQGTAA